MRLVLLFTSKNKRKHVHGFFWCRTLVFWLWRETRLSRGAFTAVLATCELIAYVVASGHWAIKGSLALLPLSFLHSIKDGPAKYDATRRQLGLAAMYADRPQHFDRIVETHPALPISFVMAGCAFIFHGPIWGLAFSIWIIDACLAFDLLGTMSTAVLPDDKM